MGQASSVIELLKSGRHSVDAKNGAQDRCDTEKTFVTSPARLSLKIPRLERTAELCQLYGRRHFHSRVDNLRAQKYRADLARNRIVAIKIPPSVALGWRRMGLVRGHAKRTKTTS